MNLQDYQTELTIILGILIPILPTLIARVLSDRRLQSTFIKLKDAASIRIESVTELKNKMEYLGSLISNQEKQAELMQHIMSNTEDYGVAFSKMFEVANEALKEIQIATEQLKLKDETIAWLSQELKEIKTSLGVRK